MIGLEIKNAEDIDRLVKRIRTHADAKAIRKQLFEGLNSETKEVRGEMKAAIPAALPGRLAAEIQRSTRFTTTAKSGRYAGVTIWARNRGHDIRTLTGKRLRHPVYGNRSRWVNQTAGVHPEQFVKVFAEAAPALRLRLRRVMSEIARKVEG